MITTTTPSPLPPLPTPPTLPTLQATGTYLEMYNGMVCSDGGTMSGSKMTPLFQDHQRPQLIVDLMQTGYPSDMVYRVNTTQYASLIRQGQDEAIEWLQTGADPRGVDAIALCPVDANVEKNLCEQGTHPHTHPHNTTPPACSVVDRGLDKAIAPPRLTCGIAQEQRGCASVLDKTARGFARIWVIW